MKSLQKYLGTKSKVSKIQATDETISQIVRDEINRVGNKANLNHIDVSRVTNFKNLFKDTDFQGDVSQWDMSNAEDTGAMFYNCKEFNCDLSNWYLDNIKNASCMFQYCESLESTPHLPVKVINTDIYYLMFHSCKKLKHAPELPATVLYKWCYTSMFRDCISLETAPDLLAKKLKHKCYYGMFHGCKNLKNMPKIDGIDWNNKKFSEDMFTETPFENNV